MIPSGNFLGTNGLLAFSSTGSPIMTNSGGRIREDEFVGPDKNMFSGFELTWPKANTASPSFAAHLASSNRTWPLDAECTERGLTAAGTRQAVRSCIVDLKCLPNPGYRTKHDRGRSS